MGWIKSIWHKSNKKLTYKACQSEERVKAMEYAGLVVRKKVVGVHHVPEEGGRSTYQGTPLRPLH